MTCQWAEFQQNNNGLGTRSPSACRVHLSDMEAMHTDSIDNDPKAIRTTTLLGGSMLEDPVFVCWCVNCGLEVLGEDQQDDPNCQDGHMEDIQRCPRCSDVVRRHQRILELPDEEVGPLSLDSLKSVLADMAPCSDICNSARLLADQGADAGLAESHPEFVFQLVELGVPRAVQRALVSKGFETIDQLIAAASSDPCQKGTLAVSVGFSAAAEIILRRLQDAATIRRADEDRKSRRRRVASSIASVTSANEANGSFACGKVIADSDSDDAEQWRCDLAAAKRLRLSQGDCSLEEDEIAEAEMEVNAWSLVQNALVCNPTDGLEDNSGLRQ